MSNADLFMLRDAAGMYLSGADHTRSVFPHVGDDCIWLLRGGALRCAVSDATLPFELVERTETGRVVRLEGDAGDFVLQQGPTRLPSEHLAELRASGFTVLERLLDEEAITRVKASTGRELAAQVPDAEISDGRVFIPHGLAWSADVARAVTHPVALWLMQQFLGTDAIHFCHPPSVTMMRPARQLLGAFPEEGWHSDYPYHPGVFPDDRWPEDRVFGVQFNLCVDPFRPDNAATQYLPGSHTLCRWPPREFNVGGTRMGEGVHRDVKQMQAPAGAALIYDARTWHRACDELNVSGEDRVAVLNAVAPAWVLPMTDKRGGTAAYRASKVRVALTDRERADIERLCDAPTMAAPPNAPQLRQRVRDLAE